MKRLLSTVVMTSLIITTGLSTNSARAQAPPPPIDCAVVESLGSALSTDILDNINERVAGASHRISRRKTLIINNARSVSFSSCELELDLDVTLERKIRRNAHGNIVLRGNISSIDLAEREVCYTGLRVADVNLSLTLRPGEAAYRWVANAVLPNSGCLSE